MSQKSLITILCLLLIASAAFLFWQNERELDPDQGKSWWTLAFAVPGESGNLSFVVENHSTETAFQYEITVDKTSIAKDTFVVKRGEKMIITQSFTAKPGKRTIITVTLGKEKKEIYRQ
ncbi:MAG: hypothetical protein Q8Q10_01900 [bacterium]|nr:hypothetical protein [bacterium]